MKARKSFLLLTVLIAAKITPNFTKFSCRLPLTIDYSLCLFVVFQVSKRASNTDKIIPILQVVKYMEATAKLAMSMTNVVSGAFAWESSQYCAHEYGNNSHPCLFLRGNDT